MGVMLSLDRNGPAMDHRRARHARRPGGQARAPALVAMRRDQASASRLMSRLTGTVLARRNRPHRDATAPPAAPAPAAGSAAGSAAGRAPAA
jgi:hypothetical protein